MKKMLTYICNNRGEIYLAGGEPPLTKKELNDRICKIVERYNKNGYKTIHLFGNWYFVRNKSKNYTKISYYKLKNLAKPRVVWWTDENGMVYKHVSDEDV